MFQKPVATVSLTKHVYLVIYSTDAKKMEK